MKKKIGILGFVLGIIILLLAAKPLIAPTIQKKIAPPDKIYTNQKFGFSLTYPNDWQTEEWDIEKAANLKTVTDGTILYQGKFFGKDGQVEFLIWQSKTKATTRQFLTWYRHEDLVLADVPLQENYTFAGLPAIRYLQQKTAKKLPVLYIFFQKDDKIYELTQDRRDLIGIEATTSAQLAFPVYDKIIGSFRFIE